MLQAIRERAQGWIAWAIVIMISVPFALWGIQSYLGVGGEPIAAKVNGQEITQRELDQRFHEFKLQLRERLGAAYRPELFDDAELHRQVLDDMIRNILVLQASADMGLRAGDEQVRATILGMQAFQKDGHFDKTAYERALRYRGVDSTGFEYQIRSSLMTAQLSNVVGASELITDRELNDAVKLRKQQRDFSYFVLPVERFQDDGPVTDEEAQAYYQAHEAAFRMPEQVKLEYLLLEQSGSGNNADIDEEALKKLYAEHQDDYRIPEQRRARHILLTVDDDSQQEKVREKIEGIRERLLAGEDFATLAKEYSQDPGSADKGGDLGFFKKGLMDPAFDNEVFSLKKDVISKPVRTRFGYHLIEVTDIHPESVEPFDEVRDKLVKMYEGGEAERKYFDQAERLGNLSYESPDSLVPAADALGLKIQHTGWIDRNGGEGVLGNPKVLAAAFSDDVLQGNNSELIEVDDKAGQKAIVVRVADHREASLEPLEEVRVRIDQAVRKERAEKAAQAQAEALVEKLRGGESMADAAAGYELKQPGLVSRDAGDVPAAVMARVFTLPKPGADAQSFGTATLGGGAAVIALSKVEDGSLADVTDQQQKSERRSLARTLARSYYADLVNDLQQRADIEITKKEGE